MTGLFFCLASAEGAGLLFCPAAIQSNTSVYGAFCIVHVVIPPTPQNSSQGFAGAFPAICRVLLLLCGGCIHPHCTTCVTLERITAPQHLQRIPDTRRHAGRCTAQRSRPIIIRYIMAQHIADHASQAACNLAPGQQSGRGGRRGTIDGYRRISFRAFAR